MQRDVDQGFRKGESGEPLPSDDKRPREDRALVAVDSAGRSVIPERDRASETFVQEDDSLGLQNGKHLLRDAPQPEEREEQALTHPSHQRGPAVNHL